MILYRSVMRALRNDASDDSRDLRVLNEQEKRQLDWQRQVIKEEMKQPQQLI